MQIQSIQAYNAHTKAGNFKAKFVNDEELKKFVSHVAENFDKCDQMLEHSFVEKCRKTFYMSLEKFRDVKYDYPVQMRIHKIVDGDGQKIMRFYLPHTEEVVQLNLPQDRTVYPKYGDQVTDLMDQFMNLVNKFAANLDKHSVEPKKPNEVEKILNIIS